MRFFEDSWKFYSFGDLFNVANGINKEKESFGVGYPIVNYMDVNKHAFLKKDMIFGLVNSTQTEQGTYSILPNDLIVTRTSETIDEIAYSSCLLEEIPHCVFSGFLLRARPLTNKTHTVFMVYELRSETYRKVLKKYSTETSRALINSENLKKVPLCIPSLENQQKIASFLVLIDERIETQSKIIEDLELYKNTIANQLIYNNPLLGKTIALKEYATLKNGYAFKSDTYSESGNYKVITIANVTGDKYISTTNCNKIDDLPIEIQSHQILIVGDILISLTGNVGRVSIVNEENCLLNQRVGVLFFKNTHLKKYLFQVLSNKLFETKMVQKGQGAAQKNIGNADVESFLVPISSNLEYVNKITKLLDAIDKKIAVEKQILEKLKEQKKFLLSNMFI